MFDERAPHGKADSLGLVGTILAQKVRVDRLVAEGRHAQVYAGRHLALDVAVAIKVLETRAPGDAVRVTTFLEEAKTLAQLRRPSIVAVLDAGTMRSATGNAVTWVAMEWIDGATLAQDLAARRGEGGRSPAECMDLLRPVLEAIAAAHEAKIVHRDLKAGNVILASRQSAPRARVLDFGIARLMEEPPSAPSELAGTQSLAIAFTPNAAAPEQITGTETGPWTDVFALALLFTEMLTDRQPFAVGEPPRRPTPRDLGVDVGAWDAVLARALSREPSERPADARALLAELDAALPQARHEPCATTGLHASAPVPTAPISPRWSAWIGFGLVACVVAASAATIGSRVRSRASPPPAPIASASPQPSIDPRAWAEYAAALQSLADDSVEAATRAFDRAIAIDPSFAAAHLRRALLANQVDSTARAHYAAAQLHRAQLDARGLVLLDAFEPLMRSAPDVAETERRLMAASAAAPDDTELLLALAKVRWLRGDPAGALTAIDRALAISPALPLAYERRGYALALQGDNARALAAYDDCIRTSPAPATCMQRAIKLLATDGRCDEAEAMARRALAVDPDSAAAYAALSEALVGRGASIDAVRLALGEKWARTDEAARAATRSADELALAVLRGDAAAARAQLDAWDAAVSANPEEMEHFLVLSQRAELALERGLPSEAARAANDFLARRAAWTPHAYYPDLTIYADAFLRRAGALSADEYARRRDAWIAGDAQRTPFFSANRGPLVWGAAYAAGVRDADEARAAIAQLDRFGGVGPPFLRDPFADVPIGRAFLRAGDPTRARPFFTRAAAACGALAEPLLHVRALLLAGNAAESMGDAPAACAAYARVLTHWSAFDGSTSAAEARRRSSALRCPRSR